MPTSLDPNKPLLQNLTEAMELAARGSYDRNSMDVLDYVLYDTMPFAATTVRPVTTFFSTPIGGTYTATTAKTIIETNMQLQGQIPSSQYVVVKEMSFALVPIIAGADVDQNLVIQAATNILQASTIKVVLAGRSFDTEVPGSVFMPPFFAQGLNSAANGSNVGFHTSTGWMTLTYPIVIEGGAAFSVQQATGSAIAANLTILNTASDLLATQAASLQFRMKGTLIRYK